MKSFAKILSLAVLPILCASCKAPWHQTVKEANDELWENCGFLSFFQILGEKGLLNGFRDPRCDQNWLDYNECQYHSKYDFFQQSRIFPLFLNLQKESMSKRLIRPSTQRKVSRPSKPAFGLN